MHSLPSGAGWESDCNFLFHDKSSLSTMNNTTGQRVLLVEDEVPLAEVLRDYLLDAHYQVEMRHDGDGVVDLIRRTPPDLILLDLMLPGVDGLIII